ncbi:unnamed protein product [Blepharisma stoltei]|uniref:Uncharacterized protein n=1 Tax=Blepharisma stoltei TaxID=1481888 RepID=A0AAU9IAU9_9CILI|nr:unnamed protein product [Blepharisma stoltei]
MRALRAPATLFPLPIILAWASFKVLRGNFARTFLSFCAFRLSSISPFLHFVTLSLSFWNASRGSLSALFISDLSAPFTLLPPPIILEKASFSVLIGILSRAFFSFADLRLSSTFPLLHLATLSFSFWKASRGKFLALWINPLRAPATLSPPPIILAKASFSVLIGTLARASFSFAALRLSRVSPFLHLVTLSLSFWKASRGKFLALWINPLRAPATLSPPPTILAKASFSVLTGTLASAFLSLAALRLSSVSPFLHLATLSLSFWKASRGKFLALWISPFKAPATLFPPPMILDNASFSVLIGTLASAFVSLADLRLSRTWPFLHLFAWSLSFLSASRGTFLALSMSCLRTPETLSPPPIILAKASFSVLIGIFASKFASLADFKLSRTCPFLHLFAWSLSFLSASRGTFLALSINPLRTPATLSPPPTNLTNASFSVLTGTLSRAFLSLAALRLSSILPFLQLLAWSLSFLSASRGTFFALSINALRAPATLSPPPTILAKASFSVLIGTFSSAFCNLVALTWSNISPFLTASTKFFHILTASLGFFSSASFKLFNGCLTFSNGSLTMSLNAWASLFWIGPFSIAFSRFEALALPLLTASRLRFFLIAFFSPWSFLTLSLFMLSFHKCKASFMSFSKPLTKLVRYGFMSNLVPMILLYAAWSRERAGLSKALASLLFFKAFLSSFSLSWCWETMAS